MNIQQYFCKLIPHGFKINYYPEKNDIIYSCLLDNNNSSNSNYNIFAKSFDLNLVYNKSIYIYNISTIHGYSIIYFDDKEENYIISDSNCPNKSNQKELLLGNLNNDETNAHLEYEKEIIKVKEEKIVNQKEEEYIENNKKSFEERDIIIKEKNIRKLEENIIFYGIEKSEEIQEKYYKIKNRKLEEGNEIKDCIQSEKCELCNEESLNVNLCIKCNNLKGYYFLNVNSISKEQINNEYIDCVNEEAKPSNFYFDIQNEDFKPCFETCATCNTGGDMENNNCITCEKNYIITKAAITGRFLEMIFLNIKTSINMLYMHIYGGFFTIIQYLISINALRIDIVH